MFISWILEINLTEAYLVLLPFSLLASTGKKQHEYFL